MANKVNFRLHSKEKLAEFVWDLRNSFPKGNLKERNDNPCIYMGFSKNIIKKMLKSKKLNLQLKKEIAQEIKISTMEKEEIRDFIKKFREFWTSKVNDVFFKEIKNCFDKKYIQQEYICYPTKKVTGAYFGKNEITVIFEYPKSKLNKFEFASVVLAEEILHLVYWELWKKIYRKKIKDIDEIFDIEGKKWSCWHVAEVLPEYILIQNKKFRKLNWHKDNRSRGYSWIPSLKKILDPVWKNSKNVEEFIIEAHKKLEINP